MSVTCNIRREWSCGSDLITSIETITNGLKTLLDAETIPDSSTDLEVVFPVDVSALKAVIIKSDQDITIETNDGDAPDDTLEIGAGAPYEWTENSLHDCELTTDITSLFVTNASGSDANLSIMTITDATP